ncbi:hypothetical protein [Thalassomonas actiniarum]|uniref:Lipoprotein n=1 Tax=Thalassomonas actiniarum TaxID=485447 RepID=A0AAF0C1Z9_9GAMM|nr:hypothetical protein [Thalassomonas actiniarum]WDD97285.1 hypothetical protein SG35_018315 [Thalassomonas actiniarum]
MKQLLLPVLVTCLLSGCNGSSSSDNSSNGSGSFVDQDNYQQNSLVAFDENIKVNQAVDLFLYYPGQSVSNVLWQQTSGEPVTLLSNTSKAIAFTPLTPGNYSFQVSFNLNGNVQTLSHSVNVSEADNYINARLGHVVQEGNKVSLRAEVAAELDSANIRWQQKSGPSLSLTGSSLTGDVAIFFDSPEVSQDTLIEFDVSVTQNGISYLDTVAVLIEDSPVIPSNAYFEERLASVFPYQASSDYADDLGPCLYSNQLSSSCTLGRLPLIGQQTPNPEIDDIMDRVLVSHAWMGDRFREFLQTKDPHGDFRSMLQATTGIVISYDIRPSFYWAATGAIYLDADNFWLTADERDTINAAPDYRSDFGKDLQFAMPWRYIKNNDYASESVGADSRESRSSQDGLYRLAALMYHELTHANDFFPSSAWHSFNLSTRILDAALASSTQSDQLAVAYPLQSDNMRALAQVSFGDGNASNTQKAYTPADVSGFFSADQATDFYNYASEREDYAMLFEELMMFSRYDIVRDVAVTNQPAGEMIFAGDYIVNWGQRGRIGDDDIKPRVSYVARRVLPDFDADSVLNSLPAPIAMTAGNNWVENLGISPASRVTLEKNLSFAQTLEQISHRQVIRREYVRALPYYEKPLPKH